MDTLEAFENMLLCDVPESEIVEQVLLWIAAGLPDLQKLYPVIYKNIILSSNDKLTLIRALVEAEYRPVKSEIAKCRAGDDNAVTSAMIDAEACPCLGRFKPDQLIKIINACRDPYSASIRIVNCLKHDGQVGTIRAVVTHAALPVSIFKFSSTTLFDNFGPDIVLCELPKTSRISLTGARDYLQSLFDDRSVRPETWKALVELLTSRVPNIYDSYPTFVAGVVAKCLGYGQVDLAYNWVLKKIDSRRHIRAIFRTVSEPQYNNQVAQLLQKMWVADPNKAAFSWLKTADVISDVVVVPEDLRRAIKKH